MYSLSVYESIYNKVYELIFTHFTLFISIITYLLNIFNKIIKFIAFIDLLHYLPKEKKKKDLLHYLSVNLGRIIIQISGAPYRLISTFF